MQKLNEDGSVNGFYLDKKEKANLMIIDSNMIYFNRNKQKQNRLSWHLEVSDGNKLVIYKGDKQLSPSLTLPEAELYVRGILHYNEKR